MKEIVRQLIEKIGANIKDDNLEHTPIRIERLFNNFFTYNKQLKIMTSEERNNNNHNSNIIPITTFENKKMLNDIVVSDSKFVSYCPHHITPFFGRYYFAYLPDTLLIGKSKIDSIVKYFCGRLDLQENLTNNIANWVYENVKPKGMILIMNGKHLCETLTTGKTSKMSTSAVRGEFVKRKLKMEVLQLIQINLMEKNGG